MVRTTTRKRLISLMCISPCPIIIGNNSPISIQGHEPDPNFETTLRVLEVSIRRICGLGPNFE